MTTRHESVEARRQVVQATLDARKSAPERNRLGQFATPSSLAVEIARYVRAIAGEHLGAIHFGDPAVGTGGLYSATVSVFGAERIASAVGVELDPEFCAAARELWSQGLDVTSGDFTHLVASGLPSPPNLILANPPYTRHHHLTRAEKERLQRLTLHVAGAKVSGLAGLSVYFLLLGTAWADGGYAAWLIPSEFLDVNYGAAIKKCLTDDVTLIRVHRFDPSEAQFANALVSSVVLVFRKSPPPPDHAVEVTYGGTLSRPSARETVPLGVLRGARKWTTYPRHAANDRRPLGCDGPSLGDFFRIQRGIATGSNKFFVLDRAAARRRGFPEACLRPVLPSPRLLKTTVVEADEGGYPLLSPSLCVIDSDLPEAVLAERHPELWAYLRTGEALGVTGGYLVGKRKPWYKQERREPAPYLCTYMGVAPATPLPFGSSGTAPEPSGRTCI